MTRRSLAGVVCSLALVATLGARTSATPVADAAQAGDAVALRALLKQGADVNSSQGDGMTALHWAALHGDTTMVSMLVAAGANLRATTRLGGFTALHLASQSGQSAVIGALIGAGADVHVRTSTGATALLHAARAGDVEGVSRLLASYWAFFASSSCSLASPSYSFAIAS